MTNCTWN